jgi:hypothetical protein
VLIVSIILALVPLAWVAYIAVQGSGLTVDNLFTSLILLAISGIFGLNVLLELRSWRRAAIAGGGTVEVGGRGAGAVQVARGLVESVQFFESPVGQADKSIVTLRANGAGAVRVLPFDGDLRNLLPVGKKIELKYEGDGGALKIVGLSYR